MGVTAWHLSRFSTKLIRTASLQGVTLYAEALREVRTLYTSEVVERVRLHGIPVTHDYAAKDGAIPLPATFSMELARRIGQQRGGMKARLYSEYPFPWRKAEGGPKDAFETEALEYLRRFPEASFYRFENFEGQLALRYATADRMRPSCVACHNAHPASPKRDWKEGDVRGVLEVIRPLDFLVTQTRNELRATFFLFGSLGLGGVLALVMLFLRLRDVNAGLERSVRERTAQALQSQKMAAVGQLAAGVAHEINNPLGIILGFAHSAVRRIKEDDSLAMPLRSIEREALRCKTLVQNLLLFSRQDKAQMVEFDLNETVTNTLGIIEAQARVNSVELSKELGAVASMMGDKNMVQQVIVNLCNNAIDAMPGGGKIVVRTGVVAKGDKIWTLLKIEDNGSGIPAEIQDKIFNPFFTTKEVGKGTGLGLSLVYEIVEKHGGTIELDSVVGRGTAFTVFFPPTDSALATKRR
ncbi:MAG: DUF3365 domain-containing protein [Elusimicrobia bacterium]|nr:DUF3365 domain-containing protein [Elusimicrobiota bacterium]